MSSWDATLAAWKLALQGAWLWKNAPIFRAPTTGRAAPREKTLEDACNELLTRYREYAVAGIAPTRPWSEFFGDGQTGYRSPDHPGQRVPSNLARYAGNYCNIIFAGGILLAAASHPISFTVLAAAQAVAVMSPPEIFEIDLLLPKRAGGDRAVGGAWLRLLMAAVAHGGTWLLIVLSRPARLGTVAAVLTCFAHALYRVRPWIAMAKDMLHTKTS
mmetsp:Transcript_64506/g.154047  ORF Transcript_64506/g.154047 Transcript_64506/m.154047 type:complete len:216 (-) Transcript_64506:165-812(-)